MKNTFIILFLLLYFNVKAQTLKNCSTCASQIIKTTQIKDLSVDELRFLTNDLFARKGYVFQDSDIDEYYSNKNWYKPVTANYNIEYNSTEKQNIKLFQEKTIELKKQRAILIQQLKDFKKLLNDENKIGLLKQFNYKVGENEDFIKNVLDEIFLDDIHWFKNRGLFVVSKDNGDIIKEYTLTIDHESVTLNFSIRGYSNINDGEQIYPSDKTNEYSYLYVFYFINNKLQFEKVIVAG